MANQTLVSLGFMSAKLGPHDAAEAIKQVLKIVQADEGSAYRVTTLLSNLTGEDCKDLSPLVRLGVPSEVIAIQKRTTVATERHKLLCVGFLEGADFMLVCDLDEEHPSESIAKFVLSGVRGYPASVLIPQSPKQLEPSYSYTIGELAQAFENFVTFNVACKSCRKRDGVYPNLQTGLYLFRTRAVAELLKFPWRWEDNMWDLEMAFFALRGDDKDTFRVGYPEFPLSEIKPSFILEEARAKFNMLSRLSGNLGTAQIRGLYEIFLKKYAHLIRTSVSDKFRESVLDKL